MNSKEIDGIEVLIIDKENNDKIIFKGVSLPISYIEILKDGEESE